MTEETQTNTAANETSGTNTENAAPAKPKTPAKPKGVAVKLNRGYWPKAGEKADKGETVTVAKAEAARLIEQGVAERTDPLPG